MNTKQQQLASKEIEPLQQQSPQKSKKEDQLTSPQKKTSKSLMKKGAKQKKSGRGLTVSITATTAQSVEIKPSSVFKKFTKSTESSAQQPQQNNSQYKKVYAKQNMLKSLSVGIVLKYKLCSSDFKYSNPRRVITNPSTPSGNNGMDNADGNLILYVDDVLGGRYCVKDVLGQGTFGQVARCDDMQNAGVQVAVKVIKNKRAYLKQAEVETKILELLCKKYDPDDNHHIIRLHEHFTHQGHLCIVFELLSINLFELIKQNRFRGLSTNVISVFLSQILDALVVLREAKIIHCDMKPENILLTNDLSSPKNLIKLIDFGSACFENETVYSYIQSRFYRSPDVLFGLEYNGAIDVWSLGCICAELFLGLPLFPGVSQYNQVCRIVEMLGMPPAYIIETGRLSKKYFKRKTFLQSPDDHPYELKTEQEYCMENNDTPKEWKRYFNYKKLDELVKFYSYKSIPQEEHKKEEQNRLAFVDLLYGLLQWDPNQRWTPAQARKHPFVTGEPFTGPYVPEPDPIKLTVPMKIAQPSYFTPPTYYGSHGSHGTPQRKNSTQPMQYMSPHGGSFGGSMFGPNLGPSPNAAFFGSPHMTHQQQQQQQQHHPSGIPISRSHHHQQQYMQNSPYQNSPYIGVGASPNTGSSFNMPMMYGTPSSNSLSTSANSGSFFPSPQNNSRPWAKKKHHNNNNNHNYQQQSDVDQLGEQVGGVQLDNSPSRNRSSTWAAPPQVQINDQKVHGSRRNSTKGPPVRGKPPKHYNNNRRPDHESMDVPIDSDIARKSPSNEDDLDSDNWNPFFNDDIELEDGEDKQPANQPQNQSYNPYHSGNSQKFSGSYGPGNQTRNRSGSSYNKKGRNRSGSSFKRDNVGSFVSSSSYEGNAASYGTSIPGGLSYGNEHSNMYGFSPAASSFGIGSSPSSYGGSAGGSFMDQFKKGRNKPRPATSKQNNNK